MIKICDEMPKEGQFLAVWEFNNKIWSDVCKWKNGELLQYKKETDNTCDDYFGKSDHPFSHLNYLAYIILE